MFRVKQIENLELENTITKIKSSVNGLKSRVERAKETIREVENGIEIYSIGTERK